MRETKEILKAAKKASRLLQRLSAEELDGALLSVADSLLASEEEILAENARDVEAARGSLSESMIDRLLLTGDRIRSMAKGVMDVSFLDSPIGVVLEETVRPSGLTIQKRSVPMGVIAIIYESRPNVTSDAAALALKSGSACILRSGKEAFRSAFAITKAIRKGLSDAGLPEDAVCLVEDTTRESATELMKANGYIDLLIPRGGAGLIRSCIENATVPCIQTGTGICHIYVDKDADFEKALAIVENAKTSRPSVCNAAEVCLIDRAVAADFLPLLAGRLCTKRREEGKTPVVLRADKEAYSLLSGHEGVVPAGEADFDTEFLDYILALKVVGGAEEAITHILEHSTHHSEAIVTENRETADTFTSCVDSAAVYVNASTRFTDGGEFGFGCEMGISTQKLHARGPMGLKELMSYKYVITGNGQVR